MKRMPGLFLLARPPLPGCAEMPDIRYYRRQAERCRSLLAIAVVPEIREQLRLWQREFAALADALECRQERARQVPAERRRVHKRLRPWR